MLKRLAVSSRRRFSIASADKLVSYELGPIDVQVLGDIAVAHGTVSENRVRNGKGANGEGVYMDFLEKRAGRWVVVRSGAKIVPSGGDYGRVLRWREVSPLN